MADSMLPEHTDGARDIIENRGEVVTQVMNVPWVGCGDHLQFCEAIGPRVSSQWYRSISPVLMDI